jgi:hypothetical protein
MSNQTITIDCKNCGGAGWVMELDHFNSVDRECKGCKGIGIDLLYRIDTAPRDGTEIELLVDGEWQPAVWSNERCCILSSASW